MITCITEFSLTDAGLELNAKLGLNTAEMAYKLLGLEARSCQTIPASQYESSRFSWNQLLPDSFNSVEDINRILNIRKTFLNDKTFRSCFRLEYCHISIGPLHFDYSLDQFSGEWVKS